MKRIFVEKIFVVAVILESLHMDTNRRVFYFCHVIDFFNLKTGRDEFYEILKFQRYILE